MLGKGRKDKPCPRGGEFCVGLERKSRKRFCPPGEKLDKKKKFAEGQRGNKNFWRESPKKKKSFNFQNAYIQGNVGRAAPKKEGGQGGEWLMITLEGQGPVRIFGGKKEEKKKKKKKKKGGGLLGGLVGIA